jgi:hypothetical protein
MGKTIALLMLAATLGAPGCSVLRPTVRGCATMPVASPCPAAVFIADGAGNFQSCSRSFLDAVASARVPLRVHTYSWSHGKGRIVADQLGFRHAQNEGIKLAALIEDFHRRQPQTPIFVVGHSAGSSVAITALEHTSPGTVRQAFLLAPSISANYDLRPALRNLRECLHVHYSSSDWWYLGLATQIVGTQDRAWLSPASGRVGFRLELQSEEDQVLAAKLRQRPWTPADNDAGHHGGHFGAYQVEFLQREVFPWMLASSATLPAEAAHARAAETPRP